MNERWIFEVLENGMVVAEGDCADRDTALREAAHYTMMYGQDGGEVKAIVRRDDENFEEPTVGNEVV